ncbi:MAG: hypothetical protein DRI48_07055 [Chloroflexi bacterium]|nr:MAG: hypothetical protein DRI48_07055 [Chloroflexota bacterium]
MRCEQAGEMMSERLDGRLNSAAIGLLDAHLTECTACRAEWQRLQALDSLLSSAPLVRAPLRLRVQVMSRLERRDQARRTIVGGAALALGTIALALLVWAPAILGLLDVTGMAPALLSGGPETVAQLLAFLETTGRAALVLVEQFAIPLAFLSLCGLGTALALNTLWVGAVWRTRALQ